MSSKHAMQDKCLKIQQIVSVFYKAAIGVCLCDPQCGPFLGRNFINL
jgi:hypothetical protein